MRDEKADSALVTVPANRAVHSSIPARRNRRDVNRGCSLIGANAPAFCNEYR
jgi:hypothetical protein